MYKLFDLYATYAYKKDGNIIADTYHLPMGMDEKQLIEHLFKLTEIRYQKLSNTIFGEYNKKNWYRYITIASIIQKESASKDEMAIISSVIYNRINKNINFKFKIASKIHELYTKQHDTFWIKLSISNIDKIKYQNILKEKILLECNLIDYKINKKLIEHFFSKIFTKSNEKIGLSIKFYNPKSNTIHVTCNSFIPKLFINYIEQYILTNTTYKVNFLKK